MQHTPHPWNYTSGVYACPTCDGAGTVHASRRRTIDDPYPEQPCEDCDGPHEAECPVCGFGQVVDGYDCLACQVIDDLTDAQFAKLDVAAFAAALTEAKRAREKHAAANVRLAA